MLACVVYNYNVVSITMQNMITVKYVKFVEEKIGYE